MYKVNKFMTLIFAVLATCTIFFSLPIFSLGGNYPQVDTQILFLYVLFASLFFYNFILISFFKNQKINILNPLCLLPIMIGLLSIISGFFSTNFTISLTGSPQVGQGALWYFGLGIILITFTRHYFTLNEKVLIFFLLLFITTFVSFFTINPFWRGFPVSFFYFTDYLCFFGVVIFIILTTLTKNLFILTGAFLSLGIYFHFIDNNAAKLVWVSTLVGALAYYILHKLEKIKLFGNLKKILFSSFFFTIYIVIISALILVFSFLFWPGTEKLPIEFQGSPLASLIVRGKIAEVSLYSLDTIKNFILGNGWGFIPEILLANMDTWQFDQLKVGFNLHFHTHNELIEHFVSIGLLGFILYILFIYFIFKLSENYGIYTKLAWLLFFKVSCFWFFWAATLPLMALAIACSVKNVQDYNFNIYHYLDLEKLLKKKKILFRRALSISYISITLLMAYGVFLSYQSAQLYKKISYSKFLEFVNDNNNFDEICSSYYNDYGRGGYYIIRFYDSYSTHLLLKTEEEEKDSNKVLIMANCIADDLIFSRKALNSLISASLQVEAKSYIKAKKKLSEEKLNLYRVNNYDRWMKKALLIDEKIPKRDEFLLPFLSFSLEANKIDDAISLCEKRKRKKIDAYCNLIYAYRIFEKNELKRESILEGIGYIKKSIEKGILNEKIYGWWLEEDIEENILGYGYSGIPIAPDKMFLINDKEGKKLIEILEKF